MRLATISADVDPSTLPLADDEEVLAVGDHELLDLMESMRSGVEHVARHLRELGLDGGRVRVLIGERTHRLLLLARPDVLELFDFRPLEGDAPGQVATWCGLPAFLLPDGGLHAFPIVQWSEPGQTLSDVLGGEN